ncbi:MAG TPA: hypothetical protein GXZ48_00680 [Acholeplasmataceae bacterium]|nr:hypothetical protein [Acholeplasmataceae bacterium]
MLTKTKKWLVAFVLAFVALLLVACGEKTPKQVAPEELTISVDVYVGDKVVLVGGEMYLSVEVKPENASKEVEWTSSKPEIAEVDANGKVTGKKGGVTVITATSKLDDSVKDTFEVKVLESLNPTAVLVAAMDSVKAQLPKYVDDDIELPSPANTLVTVEYYDVDGVKLANNIYRVNYVQDTYVQLECRLAYDGEEVKFPVTIQVVSDVEFNDFIAIEEAQAALDQFLQTYKDNKITADIDLPMTLTELYEALEDDTEVRQEVFLSWKSLGTHLVSIADEAAVYHRPNDDQNVRLEIVFLSGDNSGISRHDFVVKGYNKEEKLEYLLENVLIIPEEIQGQNIILPIGDSKFRTTITWESDDADTLGINGKMNPYLEEEKVVTLTATIVYDSSNNAFDFEEIIEFEITVKPAANDAQKLALDLSNQFEAEDFPHYFPYGMVEGNKIPLPFEVEEGDFEGTEITWTVNEEGLFDEEWVIQKQYLRYHEVLLTYSVTVGDDTATGQVAINVGVSKLDNTMYIGGNMYSRSGDQDQPWDELHQLKTSDGPNGKTGSNLNVYGWSGFTTYVDIDGVRYQWFHAGWYTSHADDLSKLTLTDENAIQGGLLSVSGHGGTNRQTLFVNDTDEDLKFPMAYHVAEIPENVTFELGLDKNADGSGLDRNGMAVDAYYFAMVADAEGKVIWTTGDTKIQNALKAQMEEEVGEGNPYVLPDYLEVPAGGFMICTRYAGPIGLQKIIFKEGLKFTIEKYEVAPQVG